MTTFIVGTAQFDSWEAAHEAAAAIATQEGKAQPLIKRWDGKEKTYVIQPREQKPAQPAKAPNPYVVRLEQAEAQIAELQAQVAALLAKPKRTTRKAA